MLPRLKLLGLLLPFPIIATPVTFQDQPWNSTNSSISIQADQNRIHHFAGDSLDITRCYCASKDWEEDNLFGYYWLWDYYNIHANRRAKIERNCTSSDMRPNDYAMPGPDRMIECLYPRILQSECETDSDGNTFCYNLMGREKWDNFTWNDQTRKLPLDSPAAKQESRAQVTVKCEKLCASLVSGDEWNVWDMQMLDGKAKKYAEKNLPLTGIFGMEKGYEWNHVSHYPEIDDMCPGCK